MVALNTCPASSQRVNQNQHPCTVLFVCLSLSCVQLFVTPWAVVHKIPLSMGFFRQAYWSGLSCPPPGDLPDPGIKPKSLTSVLAREFFVCLFFFLSFFFFFLITSTTCPLNLGKKYQAGQWV